MLKGHPKGLLVAFFANMGERFGFYTMMAILVLFLQAKFGLTGTNAGTIYSVFYALIYALALLGGIIADRYAGLKKTITFGIVTMAAGYVIIAIPGLGLVPVCIGLFVIAFGNGMFKGNLQAVVGNLYEDKKYSHLRDSAFSIFYMGINVGALFAPTMATMIRDKFLLGQGYLYNAEIPNMAHEYLAGNTSSVAAFEEAASAASLNGAVTDLSAFASSYIDAFSSGYNYAFGFAAIMMLVSLVIYFLFNKHLASGFNAFNKGGDSATEAAPAMPAAQEKERLMALGLVFVVVIFFWMSFHQNGLTLTFFARDYAAKSAAPATAMWFDVSVLVPALLAVVALVMAVAKNAALKNRIFALVGMVAMAAFAIYRYSELDASDVIAPEKYQHLNPFFIVALTPIAVSFFGWLNSRGKEPSAPRKIGYGMLLAAVAFVVMILSSIALISPDALAGAPTPDRVSPYWLVSTYFILTIAELFLSPMGISFVSKVAPPRYKGIMQGGWLCATALGNQLLFVGAILYDSIELWQLWAFFVICCLISATFIFSIMKRLERVTNNA